MCRPRFCVQRGGGGDGHEAGQGHGRGAGSASWPQGHPLTLSSHSYGYDAASQITSRTDDGVVATFVYDAIGQLLSETKAGYAASYTYDANGNRLTKTLNGVPEYYTYDSADKLLSAGGKTYGYDAAGRVTSVTSSGQVTSLTYDYEDRVTSITYPGGGANTFAYSGLGARVSKTDSTGSYTYRRNGSSVTSPVLSDGSAVYTPGISERRSGVSKFYHSDLKNGVQQTDSSQTFAAVRTYDAFGMPVSSSGAWAGPFGYGGKFGYQSDPDSGLMLLGHRYYDPSTGRFLTRDPIKDGRNWYAYCGNNPVSFADPDGNVPLFLALVGLIAFTALGTDTAHAPTPDTTGEQMREHERQTRQWAGKTFVSILALAIPVEGLVLRPVGALSKMVRARPIATPITPAERLAANAARGRAAEQAVARELEEQGVRFIRQPYVRTPLGGRRPDFGILDDVGEIIKYIEVKSGNAAYPRLQRLKDDWIRSQDIIVELMRVE